MRKLLKFVRLNGWYLFSQEIWFRVSSAARGRIIAREIRSTGIYVGRYSRIRGLRHIQIAGDFHAKDGLWIEAVAEYGDQLFTPRILIGKGLRASQWVHIAATNYVEIGDNCLIGSKVIITDHAHGQYGPSSSSPLQPPAMRILDSAGRVVIGRNVWLGDGVAILPNVTIGEGSVIGANSVVSRDIPSFTIAVGAPAKPIKQYDFETKEWRSLPLT